MQRAERFASSSPEPMGAVLAICLGASIGALMRWRLGLWMNGWSAHVPLGTLAANVVGGYLVGIAAAFFLHRPDVPPEWRLLIVTGFLGGLTTFSTFSAEVVGAMTQGALGTAFLIVALHLAGSLVCTFLGMATYTALLRT